MLHHACDKLHRLVKRKAFLAHTMLFFIRSQSCCDTDMCHITSVDTTTYLYAEPPNQTGTLVLQ